MRYEQRKHGFFPSGKNRKMWENFVDNVDNLVHNSFLAENQGDGMWMHFSWILWIKWISCESNMFFVQPDEFIQPETAFAGCLGSFFIEFQGGKVSRR